MTISLPALRVILILQYNTGYDGGYYKGFLQELQEGLAYRKAYYTGFGVLRLEMSGLTKEGN